MLMIEKNGRNIAVVDVSEQIQNTQDALDLMATAKYVGDSHTLVIHKESFSEAFFDLKTCLAGDILQKFSNYRVQLAIVGDFSHYKSQALLDFIRECNKGTAIFWCKSLEEALEVM